MSETIEIEVGTKFYLVPSSRYVNPRYVTVTKVGRKWLSLSSGNRADKQTLKVETAAGSPDTLYASEQAYEDKKEQWRVWGEFKRAIERCYGTPPASKFDIERAAVILGLELKTVATG